MMEYIWKIQTKSSVVLGEYKPKVNDCTPGDSSYCFPYPGNLKKWEMPVFFWQFILGNYSQIFLIDINDWQKRWFDGVDRDNIFDYINSGDIEVVEYKEGVWLLFQCYLTVSISGGQRYIKPILRKDLTDILDKVI